MRPNIMAAAAILALSASVSPEAAEDNAIGPGTKKTVRGRFEKRPPNEFTKPKRKSDSLWRLLRK